MVFTTLDTLQLKKWWLWKYLYEVIRHIEENNGNKCLVYDFLDENKEVLKKYEELWDGIKNKIENINDGEC